MGSSLRSEHHNCQLGKSTCTMWACLLLGVLGSAAAKTIYPVPEPYRWDETFTVEFPQMDDEHRGLFNAILKIERDNSCTNVKEANMKYHDHFLLEQSLFKQTMSKHYIDDHMSKHSNFLGRFDKGEAPVAEHELTWAKNWLVQHIKNTDFKYWYKLKTRHTAPEPYVWNKEFEVHYPRLDQEHVNLFVAMYNVENDLTNQDKVDHLMKIMREHFYYEEAQFCDAHDLPWDYCKEHKKKHSDFSERFVRMYAPVDLGEIKWAQDWLAQHIKNTDFAYKGHLKHETPEPYIWDESFKVDYSRLDEEHDVLFANILAVSQHPDDAAKLQVLKDNMQLHFDFEEQRFCNVEHYNCVDLKAKHYKFWVVLEDLKVPVGSEEINWAKNWLAQHIKNTNHQYKTRLEHAEEGTNFSGALP